MSNEMYTAKQLAQKFGCSDETIRRHANSLFGKSADKVVRYFTTQQAAELYIDIGNSERIADPSQATTLPHTTTLPQASPVTNEKPSMPIPNGKLSANEGFVRTDGDWMEKINAFVNGLGDPDSRTAGQDLREANEKTAQELDRAIFIREAMRMQDDTIRKLEEQNGKLKTDLKGSKALLSSVGSGLGMYQRICEAGGLTVSDKEDTERTYRRGNEQV